MKPKLLEVDILGCVVNVFFSLVCLLSIIMIYEKYSSTVVISLMSILFVISSVLSFKFIMLARRAYLFNKSIVKSILSD